jgi:Holliday junction resolvase RusA-like endonuclease
MARNPFDDLPRHLAEVRAHPSHVDSLSRELSTFVYGTPKPKGSKTYKGRRGNGSAILVESADVAPWATEVTRVVREAGVTFAGPVSVDLRFCLRRPQRARIDAPADRKPDVDKLARAVLDALTEAGAIEDDARVVELRARKVLVGPGQTGCRVVVRSA